MSPGEDVTEVTDPVCGEVFPPELATFKSPHEGREVFFCSVTCKRSFDEAPARYPLDLSEARHDA